MFRYPFGVQELWGIAARGCYDLSQHAKFSGTSMEYFDEEKKRKYVPHVIEPAVGVDRITLAILVSAYAEETTTDEKGQTETRVVMRFAPRVAPIKVAVFPLLRNKPPLVSCSRISPPSGTIAATSANATAIRTNKAPRGASPSTSIRSAKKAPNSKTP
jgi:glycyl-tRNA synthetase